MKNFLGMIPRILASKASIVIFIFLFIYLVGFGIIGLWLPAVEPSATLQLILGNYTNVTSATGASIAAGAGTAAVATGAAVLTHVRRNSQKYEELKQSHDEMRKLVEDIHKKVHSTK